MTNQPLLSAEQASEQLGNIVEKFFSWNLKSEDDKIITRLLVRSPPGLGKTREALDWATQFQTDRERRTGGFGGRRLMELALRRNVAVFVPRHALADEVKEVINGTSGALAGATLRFPSSEAGITTQKTRTRRACDGARLGPSAKRVCLFTATCASAAGGRRP